MSTVPTNDEQLRAEVRARYARTALQVLGTEQPQAASCCGSYCRRTASGGWQVRQRFCARSEASEVAA